MKALEVLVPVSKAEAAKSKISISFFPDNGKKQIKANFEDTYMFVGLEKHNRTDKLAQFFGEMIGRQQFRSWHSGTIFITSIVKNIDTKITTLPGIEKK